MAKFLIKKTWAMPSSHPCHPSLVSHFLEMMETNGEKRCFPHFEAKTRTRSRGKRKIRSSFSCHS
jgi:hypothetical protein